MFVHYIDREILDTWDFMSWCWTIETTKCEFLLINYKYEYVLILYFTLLYTLSGHWVPFTLLNLVCINNNSIQSNFSFLFLGKQKGFTHLKKFPKVFTVCSEVFSSGLFSCWIWFNLFFLIGSDNSLKWNCSKY